MTNENLEPRNIVVARCEAGSTQFGAWQILATGTSFDQPWMVHGSGPIGDAPLPNEFYIAWRSTNDKLGYLRSMDGGLTWRGGNALFNVNDPGSLVPTAHLPLPRVHGTRPLYVGYDTGGEIEVLRGDDIGFGPHAGEVQFTKLQLIDSTGTVVAGIPYNLGRIDLQWALAGPDDAANCPRGYGVDMSVDPTNPIRLYIVYQDTETYPYQPGGGFPLVDTDVNVYLRVLTRVDDLNPRWYVSDRILVADDSDSDQFLPVIRVDATGRVHVAYYDDRNYRPNQNDNTFNAKFDLYYAWSSPGGQEFLDPLHVLELCDDPPLCASSLPAVDYADGLPFTIRDYLGIAVGPDRIWTSFMGTTHNPLVDPNPDKSLIWSTQISP